MSKITELLLIDDDQICNFYLQNLLDNCPGFKANVRTALNGQEAMDIIEEHWYNTDESKHQTKLIFLDLNMPVMDGFEFLDTYSKHPLSKSSEVVIYVLSSSLNISDQEKALGYPTVQEYLTKPFKLEQLQVILDRHQTP